MSVLTKLIQDREEWSASYRQSAGRRGLAELVEYALFGLLVACFIMYYHEIVSTVTALIGY